MKRAAVIGAVLAITLAAAPALAQEPAEDWDLTVDPAQELTLASLDFGANALALRCKAGVLDFLLTGVPPTTATGRVVQVTAGGIEGERQYWETEPGLPVLSASEPDRLARLLRSGGDLALRIEPLAAGERPLRYMLPVSPSAASLDRVLSACDETLTDDWDLRPRADDIVAWSHQVQPEYPEAAIQVSGLRGGRVVVGCIVPADGRFSECRVLSETPANRGFGRSALAAALRSSVELPENGTPSVGKVVHFMMRFRPAEE